MKRVISFFLFLIFMAVFTACNSSKTKFENASSMPSKNDKGESMVGMANPMKEYSSLEEINKIAGSKLNHPGVMGVTNEKFFVISGLSQPLAEYRFTLNGYDYNYRCAAVGKADISGIYENGKTIFPAEPEKDFETYFSSKFKAARWFTLDGQYIFTVTDNGEMAEDVFLSICDEVKAQTIVFNSSEEY